MDWHVDDVDCHVQRADAAAAHCQLRTVAVRLRRHRRSALNGRDGKDALEAPLFLVYAIWHADFETKPASKKVFVRQFRRDMRWYFKFALILLIRQVSTTCTALGHKREHIDIFFVSTV